MDYLPLFTRLEGRPCLLVGGGAVALRKARLLLRAGADLDIVALELCDELQQWADAGKLRLHKRGFDSADVVGRALVVAATDDYAVNRAVSEACSQRQISVNVVDQPELCTVILPAIIDRSPLIIAISSGGRSPVLARMLRARLESFIPAAYGPLAEFAGRLRARVKLALPDDNRRRYFWESLLEGPAAEMVLSGRESDAESLAEKLMAEDAKTVAGIGEVYLVGAGPGDPDLLTFKALRLMQKADVVLYDRLVSQAVLDMVRRDAELIHVGKRRDQHTVPQQGINALLVAHAKKGRRVLRLKGGDPFIFGRGGEEIETLAEHGVPFQVVPGITAAAGCASYAGIPLTHRDYAQSLRLVTGHLKDGSVDLPWDELVKPRQTLVFYMGLVGLPEICRQLSAHGMAADMPAALVEKGTTAEQRVMTGTISDLPDKVAAAGFRAPTLIIIGEVVKLRSKLNWFEHSLPEQQGKSDG